jgi:rhamnosyltransferase
MNQPLVSLIIRTYNEERWITSCLNAVFNQTYKNIEVVIVDNLSTDQTLNRAKNFPVNTINIVNFLPGKAINEGIRISKGEIIVCISGHCVPVNNQWLEKLIKDLTDPSVAGVYGRQEPLSYSSDLDKRDLITIFGLDKKIQIRDPFFHNANSAFTRKVWEAYPFDEDATNIEDRIWGQEVIAAGLKIVYEPDASVFHWHGINHDLNLERAQKIVRILENINQQKPSEISYNKKSNIFAIIPVRGDSLSVNNNPLIKRAIQSINNSTFITHKFVVTDNQKTAELARENGVTKVILRPPELSEDFISIADVLQFALHKLEPEYGTPDFIVLLEETYPFRQSSLIDKMVARMKNEGYDTLLAVKHESRGIFLEEENCLKLVADGFIPSQFKKSRGMIGLMGLACIIKPSLIRSGELLGKNIGLFEVTDPFSSITIRNSSELSIADNLFKLWEKNNLK